MRMAETETPNSRRILVVENHPDTVKWLQLLLEDMGHSVMAVRDLARARAALKEENWDILISDIGLPDGTGWELLENAGERRPPFAIAMSGFGMNADTSRSEQAGFRHHLLKPFRYGELEKLLSQAAHEASIPK